MISIVTISNPYVKYTVVVAIIFAIAFILSGFVRISLNRFIKISSLKLKVDYTKYNFIKNGASFLIYLGALITAFFYIPALKQFGVTLFAGAGVMTAILLFASQQAFSNIIGGIFIIIFRPFSVDDIIKVTGFDIGKVEDITLRHTVIRSYENRRIIIPNSIINNETVINSSIKDHLICNFIDIGISYDSDLDKAIKIIQEEAFNHQYCIDNRTEQEKSENIHPVTVRTIGFGDSSVNLRAYAWSEDHSNGFIMKCDLFKSIKEKFDANGIEIPFPYRTIVYKKDI